MRVLSLFDGYAGGLEALKRAGIKVSEYHAFEIDKYAIQVAKKNHPEITHHGEITFMTDFSQFKGFDLLIGGSPCQGFSFAGKGLNFKDPRSQLFFEFVRAKRQVKPKWFLLENVKMKKEFSAAISKLVGCEFMEINSALVSAQNRVRMYWCNWKVRRPEDKGLLLKDIIEHGVVDRDKSYCIDANYWKGGNLKSYFEKSRRQLVFEIAKLTAREFDISISASGDIRPHRLDEKKSGISEVGTIKSPESKSCTLIASHVPFITAQRGRNIVDGKRKTSVLKDNYLTENMVIRKLTPIECERLQTLPDNYTEGVSNSQRYRMLGNGWNIETITHVFKEMQS